MDYISHNGEHLHGHQNHHHVSRKQSFSSALLAAICKSTEDDGGMVAYTSKHRSQVEMRNVEAENNRLTRNSRIERLRDEDPWLGKEKSMRGRSVKMGALKGENYETEAEYNKRRSEFRLSFQSNMSSALSCSSDYMSDTSSISYPYLSLAAESLYTHNSSLPTANRTRRNSYHAPAGGGDGACRCAVGRDCSRELHGKLSFRDGDFRSTEKPFVPADHHANIKSKSRTGKDFNKPKQPTSPGRKLASLFNSLFMAGGTKKTKLSSSSSSVSDSNSQDSSGRKPDSVSLSSSSVQFKSCLSKTPRGSNNSTDRMSQKSVTFYPTSLIVDEDSRPSGEKCLDNMEKYSQITHIGRKPNPSNYPHITHPSTDAYKLPLLSKELRNHTVHQEERHAAAAAARAKEIVAKYQKANKKIETVVIRGLDKLDEGEEDDDRSSCSSSELFELENLSAIFDRNMDVQYQQYQKELPVYETTHVVTNKAIAKA